MPANQPTLTQSRLKEVLHYDPDTGQFIWTLDRGPARSGAPAGTIKDGYLVIRVDRVEYRAHRLAWLYLYGQTPKLGLDHKDGVRSNNKISNLREALQGENNQNQQRANKRSKSGLLGAFYLKHNGKWKSAIQVDRKRRCLGVFDSAEEAHQAYLVAKVKYHPFQTIA